MQRVTCDNARQVGGWQETFGPDQGGMRHAPAIRLVRRLCRSGAVEVGFEPTEDLRLHTLSSTAHQRSPPSASVRACANTIRATTGERWRTGVNETKTETRRGLLLPRQSRR